MIEQKQDNHWHVKKEINLAHMFTTGGLIIAVVGWIVATENRISVLELRSQTIEKQYDRIYEELVRINAKIDRKADK